MIEDRADTLDTAGVVGRATELSEISRFLDGAQPSALILEGEPGIGKTMLWQAGVDAARERLHSVLVCRPAEAEAKLGYAALGDLLSAVSDEHVAELDEPQRRALNIALLRSKADGSRADPRAVSLGLLNLLGTLTKAETAIVAIDDVQWLDAASARALDFALRRLEHLPVGLLVSQRVGESGLAYERLFDGRIARLTVGPLPPSQLGQVLREQTGLQLSLHTTTRIHRIGRQPLLRARDHSQFPRPERDVPRRPSSGSIEPPGPRRPQDRVASTGDPARAPRGFGAFGADDPAHRSSDRPPR